LRTRRRRPLRRRLDRRRAGVGRGRLAIAGRRGYCLRHQGLDRQRCRGLGALVAAPALAEALARRVLAVDGARLVDRAVRFTGTDHAALRPWCGSCGSAKDDDEQQHERDEDLLHGASFRQSKPCASDTPRSLSSSSASLRESSVVITLIWRATLAWSR